MDRLHILLWLQRILPGSVSWSQFLKNFLWHFLINHTSSFVLSYFFKDRIWWYITALWAIHELVHMCVIDNTHSLLFTKGWKQWKWLWNGNYLPFFVEEVFCQDSHIIKNGCCQVSSELFSLLFVFYCNGSHKWWYLIRHRLRAAMT